MIMQKPFVKRSTRKAAAVVEFAVIAPLFFMLLLGIIEFGRMLMVQQILVNAAREGARAATLPAETDAQVTTTVSNYMSATGVSGYTETLSPALSTSPASGTALTVTISVPCSKVDWLPTVSPWFSGKSISASVVMIKQ